MSPSINYTTANYARQMRARGHQISDWNCAAFIVINEKVSSHANYSKSETVVNMKFSVLQAHKFWKVLFEFPTEEW